MAVKGLIEFVFAYIKTNLQSAMEYRANFIVQSVGMFINDIAWIAFWAIFFARFPVINGWGFNDVVLMYSIITMGFGAVSFIFGNWEEIADIIVRGKLDYYLSLPKPTLLHVLISSSDFSGVGDFFFGIVLFFIAVPLSIQSVILFVSLVAMSLIILLHFAIIIGSIAFFTGGTGKAQQSMFWSVMLFSTYPFSAFEGIAKIILLTAIPVGFITGIPVEIMKSFSPTLMMYMAIATVAITVIANIIFKIGLKRYESGNLINVRV